jgi:hypothetical protein
VNIANRRFVDETIGAVVAFCTFGAQRQLNLPPAEVVDSAHSALAAAAGGRGASDTHLFRVESGRLRYVHTLRHLLQANFQGGRGRAGGAVGRGADGGGGQRGETAPNPQR